MPLRNQSTSLTIKQVRYSPPCVTHPVQQTPHRHLHPRPSSHSSSRTPHSSPQTLSTLSSLLPNPPNTNQAAHRARQPDDPIVQPNPAQRTRRHRQITHITQQLQPDSRPLALDLLRLHHALALLPIHLPLPLPEPPKRVPAAHDAAQQADGPRPVRLARDALRPGAGPDPRRVEIGDGVQTEVDGVAELAPDGRVLQHGIEGFRVGGQRSRAEVLDVLADAEQLAREAEVGFYRQEGRDCQWGGVGAEQVEGEEAREVLQRAEELVAADFGVESGWLVRELKGGEGTGEEGRTGGGDVAEVVRYCWVVDEGVGDHGGG